MVNKRHLLIGGTAVLVILALILFYPTDRRKVKRKFGALAAWVEKDGEEGAIATVQTAQEAKEFFANPCEWQAEERDLNGSISTREIAQIMFAFRSRYTQITVKFYDLTIDFPEDGVAETVATARVTASSKDGEELNETREVRCQLREIDGEWLISKVTLVQVLKR